MPEVSNPGRRIVGSIEKAPIVKLYSMQGLLLGDPMTPTLLPEFGGSSPTVLAACASSPGYDCPPKVQAMLNEAPKIAWPELRMDISESKFGWVAGRLMDLKGQPLAKGAIALIAFSRMDNYSQELGMFNYAVSNVVYEIVRGKNPAPNLTRRVTCEVIGRQRGEYAVEGDRSVRMGDIACRDIEYHPALDDEESFELADFIENRV